MLKIKVFTLDQLKGSADSTYTILEAPPKGKCYTIHYFSFEKGIILYSINNCGRNQII
jgi:hypothetical protein